MESRVQLDLPLVANQVVPSGTPDDRPDHETPLCPHGELGSIPRPRPRVISASKRTDVPAFYLRWFIDRVEAGWVDVPNPMFRYASDPLKRLSHVSLHPAHVRGIVWWSKNYAVYERFCSAFSRYPVQFFHFTINPRRDDLTWIEPDVPPIDEALRQVRFLASLPGGPSMVAWRYDPIVFWAESRQPKNSWDPDFFERMCRALAEVGVRRCFTSLADRYTKFEQRVARHVPGVSLREPTPVEIDQVAGHMASIGAAYGIEVLACTEQALACRPGLAKGACIDGALLGGSTAAATDRKMRGREECGCTLHTDVGDYVTQECGYSCVYCYANPNHRRFASKARAALPLVPNADR